MTSLLLASIVGDAADIVHAGTVGLLSLCVVVLALAVWTLYKRLAALQEQRVQDARAHAREQQEHRDQAIGVATLAVEALNRQHEPARLIADRLDELAETDKNTHALVERYMAVSDERDRGRR